ncbi:MAG TPA: LysR family transcriptional regulator [Thermoanaerobacterales bacterium]|jgi:LysR family hydrogen peroxide-inducible transcriptional activator|nr:LysR family transcriptional regulator [Thermoanaerobacterales bacterium]
MDFRKLHYILTIAEEGSINKAAQKLFIAQSSLSQFLKKYELSLGYALFYRTRNGMQPTNAGIQFLAKARQIINIYQDLQNDLIDMDELKSGNIRVGMSVNRSACTLPAVLPVFSRRYPNIVLDLVEGNSAFLETKLIEGTLDVAFFTLPLHHKKLHYEPIQNEEMLVATKKGHPLINKSHPPGKTGRRWINIKDTEDIPYILLKKGQRVRDFADEQFRINKISPPIFLSTFSPETALRLSETGLAITFIPKSLTLYQKNMEYFSIGKDGTYRTLCLAYPNTKYIPKAVRAFSEVVKDTVCSLMQELA